MKLHLTTVAFIFLFTFTSSTSFKAGIESELSINHDRFIIDNNSHLLNQDNSADFYDLTLKTNSSQDLIIGIIFHYPIARRDFHESQSKDNINESIEGSDYDEVKEVAINLGKTIADQVLYAGIDIGLESTTHLAEQALLSVLGGDHLLLNVAICAFLIHLKVPESLAIKLADRAAIIIISEWQPISDKFRKMTIQTLKEFVYLVSRTCIQRLVDPNNPNKYNPNDIPSLE